MMNTNHQRFGGRHHEAHEPKKTRHFIWPPESEYACIEPCEEYLLRIYGAIQNGNALDCLLTRASAESEIMIQDLSCNVFTLLKALVESKDSWKRIEVDGGRAPNATYAILTSIFARVGGGGGKDSNGAYRTVERLVIDCPTPRTLKSLSLELGLQQSRRQFSSWPMTYNRTQRKDGCHHSCSIQLLELRNCRFDVITAHELHWTLTKPCTFPFPPTADQLDPNHAFPVRRLMFNGCSFTESTNNDDTDNPISLFIAALKRFTSLHQLSCYRCVMDDSTLAKLLGPEGILDHPNLVSLKLSASLGHTLTASALTQLVLASSSRKSPRLEILDVTALFMWDQSKLFTGESYLTPFLHAAIVGNEEGEGHDDIYATQSVGSTTKPAPPSLSLSSSLRRLTLSKNFLDDDHIQVICNGFIQQSPRCRIGHGNGILSSGVANTELSPNLQEPTGVVRLPSKPTISVSKLSHRPSDLRTLVLQNNLISDDGAITIAQSLWYLQGLETLDLRKNSISEVGVAALAVALEGLFSPHRPCSSCRNFQCSCDCKTATAWEDNSFMMDVGGRSLWNIHLDHPTPAFWKQLVLHRAGFHRLLLSSSLPHPSVWPFILGRTGECIGEHDYFQPKSKRCPVGQNLSIHSIATVDLVYMFVRHFGHSHHCKLTNQGTALFGFTFDKAHHMG